MNRNEQLRAQANRNREISQTYAAEGNAEMAAFWLGQAEALEAEIVEPKTVSRYQVLKEKMHRDVCEWMRCLDWEETLKVDQLRACARSFFKSRHHEMPRFKRAKQAYNKRQTKTEARERRRMAIRMLVRAEIQETAAVFAR